MYRGDIISAGVLEQSMAARNRVGTELSYRPASFFGLAGRYDNLFPGNESLESALHLRQPNSYASLNKCENYTYFV
jgi:hypothetical protein